MNILVEILYGLVVSILLNLVYFILGLFDARISANVRKRPQSCLINFLRFALLIGLQVLYYLALGMHRFYFLFRLVLHSLSFVCLYVGTKFCVIGLTGGIACGKSTLSGILKTFSQFSIVDADKISHDIMKNNETLIREVCEEFGAENVLAEDGESIDRDKLGAIVFNDPAKRRVINRLTHKRIFYEIISQILHLRFVKGSRFVVLDAPLLFESKILEYLCFPIIVIAILDESKLRARLMARDKSSREDA